MPWRARAGFSRIGGLFAGLGALLILGGVSAVYYLRQPAAAVRTADVELIALRERLAGVKADSPQNQWPAFVALLDDVQRAFDAGRIAPSKPAPDGSQATPRFAAFDIGGDTDDPEARELVLAELRRLGVWERLDAMSANAAVPPLDVDFMLNGRARSLARVIASQLFRSSEPADFRFHAERLRKLAALVRSPRTAIAELTATAIDSLVATAAVRSTMVNPPSVDMARAMIDALRVEDVPRWADTIEGERCFILNEVRAGRWRETFAMGTATRGVDATMRQLATRVDAPTRPRAAWYAEIATSTVPPGVANMLLPDTMFVSTRDNLVLRRRAAQTIIALETRLGVTGQAPERLEELVPEFFDELPTDPFSGEPLRYRVRTAADLAAYRPATGSPEAPLPPAPKPGPRPYLLYSVAADGVDNGGVMAAQKPWETLREVTKPPSDFVLSPDEGRDR